MKKWKRHINSVIFSAFGLLIFTAACKTPKFTCPAYNEHKHRALADSTDPSNSIKSYYYYPVVDQGGSEGGDSTLYTSATSVEGIEDDSKTNEEILHETDLAKEKEEEWKPYTYFNIRMEVDSLGKPTAYKPLKYKSTGLADKKKTKDINVDKELAEDKKKTSKTGYVKVEEESSLPQ